MKKYGNKGFTLIEVIVTASILTVASLMFLVIINGTGNIMRRGADLENWGSAATENLEIFNSESVSLENGNLNIGNGVGETIAVDGVYQTVTVNDVTFTLFVPTTE